MEHFQSVPQLLHNYIPIFNMPNQEYSSQFEIRPLQLNWVHDSDGVNDLCVHGLLFLRIGNTIVSDAEDGEWTLSAVALNLLRTLNPNYEGPEDFVVPCCGEPQSHNGKLSLSGCNQGIYWKIINNGDTIHHKLENSEEVAIGINEHKEKVFAFADAVEE